MPDIHQSPECGSAPQTPNTGHETAMYTHEELVDELDKLWRDRKILNRLKGASARIWPRSAAADADALVTEAIMKLIRAEDGLISKEIPLYRTVIRNMRWVALDYLKSTDALGPKADGGHTPFDQLREHAAQGSKPGDRTHYEQLMTTLLKRAREKEERQRQKGKEKVLPQHDYLKLRFEKDLEGEALRSLLGLSLKEFGSVTKAARRTVLEIVEEGR